jgi:phenylacetate-CoA ligase
MMFQLAKNEMRYGLRALVRDNPLWDRRVQQLNDYERAAPDAIAALQERLLACTLQAARRRIPYYRRHLPAVIDGDARALLAQLPIVTKEDLRGQPGLYYPHNGQSRLWSIHGLTSGTTGSPLMVLRSPDSVVWAQAFKKRHWTWAGYKTGMRFATLRGDMIVRPDRTQPPYWFYNRYNNQLILSSRHLKPPFVDRLIAQLESFGPYLLEAYPSTGYELALQLRERGKVLSIPYVYTGSEPLYPHQRELIEERFDTQVMDHYGMAERVAYATECERGNLHVNPEYSYVEIVDDDGRPTEDEGHLVGTTFRNLTMPLIRYRPSDRAKWKRGTCACGRIYPMIEPVTGKYEDCIYGSDGASISPSVVTFAFKELRNVRCSQVAQVGRGRWEIRIIPTEQFQRHDESRLVDNIRRLVDPRLEITVKLVDAIPRTAAGKYKWVVNEYREEQRQSQAAHQ